MFAFKVPRTIDSEHVGYICVTLQGCSRLLGILPTLPVAQLAFEDEDVFNGLRTFTKISIQFYLIMLSVRSKGVDLFNETTYRE